MKEEDIEVELKKSPIILGQSYIYCTSSSLGRSVTLAQTSTERDFVRIEAGKGDFTFMYELAEVLKYAALI